MENLRACIFDLDGVLVDTAKYHYQAWKRLAQELGFDFTLEDNERLKGVSRMTSLEILLEIGGVTLTEEEKSAYAEKKNIWYREFVFKMKADEIFPGVRQLLTNLRNEGILIALGSASKNAEPILDILEIKELFHCIIDGNKTSKAKPDPEVFLKAAQTLKVAPEHCVVFEDAVAGVEAAKAGGMKCIGVGDKDTLTQADICISGIDQIDINFIKNLK